MFSRDEMQRAIEDALKTMEGVALELYRRGREEAREELEEARARNADMRAMLEQVTRERDEARADLARSVAAWEAAGMQGRTAHDALIVIAEERDEARAELSKLREDYDSVLEANVGLLDGAPYVDARAAFRRGAEAMREACAQWVDHWVSGHVADKLRDMPIPEEP